MNVWWWLAGGGLLTAAVVVARRRAGPPPGPGPGPAGGGGIVDAAIVNFRPADTLGSQYLSPEVLRALQEVSHGAVRPRVMMQTTTPTLPDGWPQQWWNAVQQGLANIAGLWTLSNYPAWLRRTGVYDQIAAGKVNVICAYGDQRCGFAEYAFRGASGGDSSGPLLQDAGHFYMVYGFNSERGLAEALHSIGHSAEARLGRHIPGPFQAWSGNADFYARFGGAHTGPLPAGVWENFTGVGNVHFPPFADLAYQYDGPDCAAWGCTHEGFLRWWLGQMPVEWWPIIFGRM